MGDGTGSGRDGKKTHIAKKDKLRRIMKAHILKKTCTDTKYLYLLIVFAILSIVWHRDKYVEHPVIT